MHDAQDPLDAAGDLRDFCIGACCGSGIAHIIRAGEQHDHFRIHSIEFAILQTPENVFGLVGSPAEVGDVPTKEVLFPVGEQFRIICGSPAACDGVTFKINVDAAFSRLVQQLLVGDERVGVGSRGGLVCWQRRGYRSSRWGKRGFVMQEFVGPVDEVFPIGAVGVSAVVLAPGKFAIEQAHFDGRHFCGAIVVGNAQVLCAEKFEHGTGSHGGHEAAFLVEPLGIALLRDAVADEGQARRAQGDEFVRVDGQVAGVLAAKGTFGSTILEKVAGHPVVFAGAGEVFDSFAKIAAMEFGAAFAGRADEHKSKARVEGHGDKCSFAITRNAFDADVFCVDSFIGFQIIQSARGAPGPGSQGAPVVRLAGLALVDETDDAASQARAVVGLNAGGIDIGVAPAIGDELFGRSRIAAGRAGRAGNDERKWRGSSSRKIAAGKHHHHGNGDGGIGGPHQEHLDIDVDGRIGRIIHVAGELLLDDGMRSNYGGLRVCNGPSYFGNVLGNSANDFALEIFHDFGPALLPPHFGIGDFLAVLQS